MSKAVLIGVDIGTTAVKAVMLDAGGQRLAGYSAGYPTARPAPGLVEQNPNDWTAHVTAALAAFAAHPRAGEVAAIGVTSQVNTHVFVDGALQPLLPAINWADGRAAGDAVRLDQALSAEEKIAALGAPMQIDASHALSRMAWLGRTAPDLWARTAYVLAPKDYVIAQLTGQVVADPISSVGLVGTDMRYAGAVLRLLDGAAGRLALLHDPLDVIGTVAEGAFAGVPVVAGTMDAWASMFGVGVAGEGEGMNLSGTSEVLGLISSTRNPVAGVITFPAWRGITLHAGPTQAGGASLDWLARLLQIEPGAAATLAEGEVIHPRSPLFLPHLEGERAPLWDAVSRGAFAGLDSSTRAPRMVASVMEGVAFSARLALEALEKAGGMRPRVVRVGGGGTSSDAWCQIRANVLGRPVERMQARDAGAMGAGVMAAAGVGLTDDLAAAARALVPVDRVFIPDPAAAALAEKRFAIWQGLYGGLKGVNAALAAL
ncbi:xylulokinase [Ketogulonicigenium vulgare]|uniref:Carbohydrate kinase FGGY n=2 Tax=Ketogulonicigenium vulgare TaxID=92945 RepID=F9Y388_KETVW|nr:FGGY-family carbohydrate kinase [Ketogulonicigenium vulgare]AEM40329.1 Carbohydrate kinase FGGY [Ketogulonicigenium vulgare WSH-001]ALJ80524.1 carbohydrate kinase [Ketogulonicigenium vulgare]ANW33349.1 carbohydrate kinase [Ketogulonicigenium vulgare]AOZ54041.1 Carbohydrate kinase FGGY [Ketogulonicigenium vulgare]